MRSSSILNFLKLHKHKTRNKDDKDCLLFSRTSENPTGLGTQALVTADTADTLSPLFRTSLGALGPPSAQVPPLEAKCCLL